MSSAAAPPAPSAPSVNESVADVSLIDATFKSKPVPGATARTVTESLPDMPAIVALIDAVPGLIALARPVELTVRTVVSELVQATVLPVIVPPNTLSAAAAS